MSHFFFHPLSGRMMHGGSLGSLVSLSKSIPSETEGFNKFRSVLLRDRLGRRELLLLLPPPAAPSDGNLPPSSASDAASGPLLWLALDGAPEGAIAATGHAMLLLATSSADDARMAGPLELLGLPSNERRGWTHEGPQSAERSRPKVSSPPRAHAGMPLACSR